MPHPGSSHRDRALGPQVRVQRGDRDAEPGDLARGKVVRGLAEPCACTVRLRNRDLRRERGELLLHLDRILRGPFPPPALRSGVRPRLPSDRAQGRSGLACELHPPAEVEHVRRWQHREQAVAGTLVRRRGHAVDEGLRAPERGFGLLLDRGQGQRADRELVVLAVEPPLLGLERCELGLGRGQVGRSIGARAGNERYAEEPRVDARHDRTGTGWDHGDGLGRRGSAAPAVPAARPSDDGERDRETDGARRRAESRRDRPPSTRTDHPESPPRPAPARPEGPSIVADPERNEIREPGARPVRVATVVRFDPYSYEHHEDPYPTYRQLRDESPAYLDPDRGFWALSRHDDVRAAIDDWPTFSSSGGITLERRTENVEPMLIEMDPPRHTELRALVSRAFTPRRVADLEGPTRALALELSADFAPGQRVDVIDDFAAKLPMAVISVMLGVPRADQDELPRVVRRDAAPRGRQRGADAGRHRRRDATLRILQRRDREPPPNAERRSGRRARRRAGGRPLALPRRGARLLLPAAHRGQRDHDEAARQRDLLARGVPRPAGALARRPVAHPRRPSRRRCASTRRPRRSPAC